MNNRGQILITIISGIMIFIAGMVFLNFLQPEVNTMMSESGLNCGNSSSDPNLSISDGAKATCLIGEIVVPYFIIIVISVAGGVIVSRFLL